MCRDIDRFAETCRANVAIGIGAGLLTEADARQFEVDLEADVRRGAPGRAGAGPRTRPNEWFGSRPEGFVPFGVRHPAGGRLTVCYLSAEYPPVRVNGIGRVVHSLATGLAAAGHVVHVVTRVDGHAPGGPGGRGLGAPGAGRSAGGPRRTRPCRGGCGTTRRP